MPGRGLLVWVPLAWSSRDGIPRAVTGGTSLDEMPLGWTFQGWDTPDNDREGTFLGWDTPGTYREGTSWDGIPLARRGGDF